MMPYAKIDNLKGTSNPTHGSISACDALTQTRFLHTLVMIVVFHQQSVPEIWQEAAGHLHAPDLVIEALPFC